MRRLAAYPLAALLLLAVPPAYAAPEKDHVVTEGETLGGIAIRAGVSQDAIIKANGLKAPFAARIGQKLKIPREAAKGGEAKPAPGGSHVVKEGETLGGIANRTGVSSSAIAKANGLKEPYSVRTGQKLVIPAAPKGTSPPKPASSGNYVVKDGETLGGIANRSGVSASALARANGLKEPYKVRVGQKLVMPGAAAAGSSTRSAEAGPAIPVGVSEYVVKEGETLGGIAYRADVARIVIIEANGLKEPYEVRTGQKLVIPALTRAGDKPPPYSGGPAPAAPPMAEPPAARFRWPIVGAINQGFNSLEAGKGHNGVDIAAAAGDPVKAAAGGIVIYAEFEKSRFGNLVIIQHDDRWHTAYGHLATITAKKGASVKSGEVIGTAGSTGIATTTEVHFEIRHANKPIDPVDLLGQPK